MLVFTFKDLNYVNTDFRYLSIRYIRPVEHIEMVLKMLSNYNNTITLMYLTKSLGQNYKLQYIYGF